MAMRYPGSYMRLTPVVLLRAAEQKIGIVAGDWLLR